MSDRPTTTDSVRPLHAEPGGSPADGRDPRGQVLWFPRYLALEYAAACLVLAVLAVISLFLDAPLQAIADLSVTPDPSKAPWYFIGLQELLHYYPPFVAGALVPGATVLFLVVLPFWGRPEDRTPLWPDGSTGGRRLAIVAGSLLAAELLITLPAAHVPWALVLPTAAFGVAMVLPGVIPHRAGALGWLARRTLPGWICAWLAIEMVLLSVIGGLFRGPGWGWVWPWIEGIYG